jgi:ribosomal protein S4
MLGSSGAVELSEVLMIDAPRRYLVERNGWRVNIPSYLVKDRDLIELRPSAALIPSVQKEMMTRGVTASRPEREGAVGRVTGVPRREDAEPDIREDLIVEFYAK